jgi:hypothetical protein
MSKGWRGVLLGSVLLFAAAGRVLAANPPDQGHSSLSAGSSVPADGQTQVTITVTLNDSTPNPVVGDSVTLTDPNNSSAVINTTQGTTDSNGEATFTMTSTNAGTDSLNVRDNTANVTFTGLGTVQFDVAPTPTPTPVGYCGDAAPGSTPQLTAATAVGTTKITLTWTDAGDPVSYYLVAYGTSTGQYIYGSPNVGAQGTVNYMVGSLAPGRTYYFAVKAVHGCADSSYSNEMAGTTNPVILPTAMPTRVPTKIPQPTVVLPPSNDATVTVGPEELTDTTFLSPTPEPTPEPVTFNPAGLKIWLIIVPVVLGVGIGGLVVWRRK